MIDCAAPILALVILFGIAKLLEMCFEDACKPENEP